MITKSQGSRQPRSYLAPWAGERANAPAQDLAHPAQTPLLPLARTTRQAIHVLFIEHVRSDDPGTSRLQDRLNRLNRLVVCCDCNRPTLDSIRAAGFTATQVEHTALPKAPPFVRPAIVGSATAPVAAPRAHQDGDLPTVVPPRVVRPGR